MYGVLCSSVTDGWMLQHFLPTSLVDGTALLLVKCFCICLGRKAKDLVLCVKTLEATKGHDFQTWLTENFNFSQLHNSEFNSRCKYS